MGCPKHFSIQGEMGAALLKNPQKVKAILSHLVANLSIPVTAKIRLLPDEEKTMELVKIIQDTGVAALAIHARYKEDRPKLPARIGLIKKIKEALSLPIIYNG